MLNYFFYLACVLFEVFVAININTESFTLHARSDATRVTLSIIITAGFYHLHHACQYYYASLAALVICPVCTGRLVYTIVDGIIAKRKTYLEIARLCRVESSLVRHYSLFAKC